MMEEMMRGGRPVEPEPEPEPERNPSGRPRTPYDEMFGDMFESGARQREDYQKNIEGVFDTFLKGMDKQR
jgi:hypothetical protein